MKSLKHVLAAAAVTVVFGAAAFAHQGMQGHDMMTPVEMQKMMNDMMPLPSDPASTKALKEAHMKMMKAMHVTFSGNADVDFVRSMMPHHQGAIDMARVELAHGKDATLRSMAQKIISDQEKEIAEMQDWLKKNAKWPPVSLIASGWEDEPRLYSRSIISWVRGSSLPQLRPLRRRHRVTI
jgi:hypothetical protein